jgi:hypothetical protein
MTVRWCLATLVVSLVDPDAVAVPQPLAGLEAEGTEVADAAAEVVGPEVPPPHAPNATVAPLAIKSQAAPVFRCRHQ